MSSAVRAFGRWISNQPYLLLSFTALFWSGNAIIGRAAIDRGMPPVGLSFWRWFLALLILLPFAAGHLRHDWPALRRSWRILLVLGSLGGASFNLCLYIGLQTTQAINAGLLQAFIPVTILLLAIPVLRERPSLRQIAGMLVAFTGVIAILFKGDLHGNSYPPHRAHRPRRRERLGAEPVQPERAQSHYRHRKDDAHRTGVA